MAATWILPVNEYFTITANSSQDFTAMDLLDDDTGLNGSILTLKSVSQGAHGTVTQTASGGYVYRPDANYIGDDGFDYVVGDQFGNVLTEHVSATVTGDTAGTPVLAPVITDVLDDVGASQGTLFRGAITDDAQPTINGTGEPGSLITVYDNGVKIGEATVETSSAWAYTPSVPLAAGTQTISVIASHPDGSGLTAAPAVFDFSIATDTGTGIGTSTDPVLAPVITTFTDNVGHFTGTVPDGWSSNDTTPILSGTGEPGTLIRLYDNGTLLGQATAGVDWQWSFTPTTALSAGSHNIMAIGSRLNGYGSTPSMYAYHWDITNDDTTDGQPPVLAPVIVSVTDNAGAVTGPVPLSGTADDTTPTLAGTGEPGTVVEILDNGVSLGTVTVPDTWEWQFTPDLGQHVGPHVFTAVGSRVDGSGSTSAWYAKDYILDNAPALDTVLANAGLDAVAPAAADTSATVATDTVVAPTVQAALLDLQHAPVHALA